MQASPRIDELRQKFHENPRRYFAPLANEYRKSGDPEQAIAICRAHLAQQPGHMSGHVVYGQALYDAKRPEEARSVFEKALSLDPGNTIVLRQLGDIAREKGESAEARHWYSRALDLDPHDTELAAYIAELTEPISDDPQPAAESPDVDTGEPEILDFVEADTEEAIMVATPAEPQGDGADPESSDGPSVDSLVDLPDIGEEVVSDQEVSVPEAQEPEVQRLAADSDEESPAIADEPAAAQGETTPAPAEGEDAEDVEAAGEVAWRKTPEAEESPFITRTMADLYARQGYLAAALDVYRQLEIRHPEDTEIRQRIADLSRARGEATEAAPREAGPSAGAEEAAPTPQAEPAEAAPAPEAVRSDESDSVDEEAFPHSSDDLDLPTEEVAAEPEVHFTETELADSLSGGVIELDESPFGEFSWENEPVDAGSAGEVASVRDDQPAPEASPQEARFVELPVGLGDIQTTIDEAGVAATTPHDEDFPPAAPEERPADAAQQPMVAEDEAAAAMVEPEPVAEEAAPLAAYEPEPEPEESPVVAYSPEPPRDEDLPHFKPRTPTIGDFFATLGAYRPSREQSITARAAIPDLPPTDKPEDLPLASDAFSTLFPDASVSAEDTRAAFALSGAMSAAANDPPPPTPRASPPKPVPPVVEAPESHESEEDIRRFREWLDGLADT